MKDIFIDNNITKNFANPVDPEYKKLIKWLLRYERNNLPNNAILVVCKKLLVEYGRTSSSSKSETNIWVIIDILGRQGRLDTKKNKDIKEFKRKHFTSRIKKCLSCNIEDWEYIPVVLLSFRKYALVADDNFRYDLNNFPGFSVRAEKRPEDLPYDS